MSASSYRSCELHVGMRLARPAPVGPGDEHEPADEPHVLEEYIRGEEPFRWRHLPETMRDERGGDRETAIASASSVFLLHITTPA
jgi:hypothetical protein